MNFPEKKMKADDPEMTKKETFYGFLANLNIANQKNGF
jgi:hypothetical protein